jgi:hypothetical protein
MRKNGRGERMLINDRIACMKINEKTEWHKANKPLNAFSGPASGLKYILGPISIPRKY